MASHEQRKEETRQRILTAATQGFRAHGFAGMGVDGIAKAAGVTSGAFYAHFGSKDKAFDAGLSAGLDEVIAAIPQFRKKAGTQWVQAFADYYLGQAHRDDLASGCAMTTLSPEVVRAQPRSKQFFATKMEQIVNLIAQGLQGGTLKTRRVRAWAVLGILIGGLTLARAVGTPKLEKEISASIRAAAVAAAGKVRDATE